MDETLSEIHYTIIPDRSITPTNDTLGGFSFDLDDIMDGIDLSSETCVEENPHEMRNILDDYINELVPLESDELGEDKNSLSLGSSTVSSTSLFGESYSALNFVEQCVQEIMNADPAPDQMEVDYDLEDSSNTFPLYFSQTSTKQVSCSMIPLAEVSALGRDIMSNSVTTQIDSPLISKLKTNLSNIPCFESRYSCKKQYFDFSTQSPDDVIRSTETD